MRGWLFFTWMLSVLLLPAAAYEQPVGMALDGTGRLWNISQGTKPGLMRQKGAGWQNVPVPEAEAAKYVAKSLTTLRDGSVACLWGDSDNWSGGGKQFGSVLSRHRGERAAVIVAGLPKLNEGRILERGDGSLLITESGPSVVVIPKQGEARVLTIPNEFFYPAKLNWRNEPEYLPVCAVEDGSQRIWLWSDAYAGSEKWRLATFIRLEGGKLSRHAVHDLRPDTLLCDMVRVDAEHLWVAVAGTGIYSLEVETGELELLPTEVPQANDDGPAWVEQMFREGEDWYAVVYPQPTREESRELKSGLDSVIASSTWRYFEQGEPCGRVLRYRAGAWELVLDGLDPRPRFGWRGRPHVLTREGLLIGSHGSGPWLASRPGGAPALRHGWETNFALPDAVMFTPLSDGKLRALASTGALAIGPIEPTVSNPRGLRNFLSDCEAIEDSKGNLWWVRGQQNALEKWDGARWTRVNSPPVGGHDWWGDDRDQGWFFDDENAAICDLTTGTWQEYPNRDAALVAQLPRGARLSYLGQQYWLPVYSGQGQIAWLSANDGLHFYDGQSWRVWTMPEIAGPEQGQLEGAPFFNAAHQLCLPMGQSDHTWNAAAKAWQPMPRDPARKDTAVYTEPQITLPEGSGITGETSKAADSLGTIWVTSAAGELLRVAPGRTVPVFTPEESNPFRLGRKVRQALIDPRGGAMLLVNDWEDEVIEYFHVPAKLPLPETAAKLLAAGGDAVRVRMSVAEPAAEAWFSWQLDGAEWHALQQEPELTLQALAPGNHRLAIRAYNAELGADRTPAVLEFTIEAGAVADMKSSIADLSHRTLERRQAAARQLRAQGISALPALKEAQKRGAADGQAWVNKVIEDIEADLAAETKKKPE